MAIAASHDHDSAARRLSEAEAALGLRLRRPEASAGSPLAPPPVLIAAPAAFLIGLGLFAPQILLALLATASAALVTGCAALRLLGAFLPPRYAPRTPLAPPDLPPLSVIIALHREAEVCAGLAASLSRLDYPADRLDIVFALEAHDVETLTAARAAARRIRARVLALQPWGPTTKPRALNYALQAARGDLIAVYDAEDAPDPAQLRAAAEAFAADPRLGVVQAPLGWYNARDNRLTRQFALEYASHFDALLPAFARLGLPLPLGGTSNVFRRSALAACGGWDPFNVTEDADLGFRLARHGWRAGLIAPRTLEEAPVSAAAWIAQRSRWLKGHAVSWLVQMRDPSGLAEAAGPGALVGLQLSLLANVVFAGLFLPGLALVAGLAVAWGLGLAGWGALAWIALSMLAYIAAFAAAIVGAHRAGVALRLSDLALMPTYWALQAPALVRALQELGGRPYLWAKTRHGVSSTLRESPDVARRHPDPDGAGGGRVRPVGLAQRPAVKPAAPAHDPLDPARPGLRRFLPDLADPSVQPVRAAAAEPHDAGLSGAP